MQTFLTHPRPARLRRRGFTLIELLVVVTIIIILSTLAIVSVNMAMSSDRVSGSARQVQSYLEGARDRAIFAKKTRGVRFLLDPNDPTVVTSMVYVGEPQTLSGVLRIIPDEDGDGTNEALWVVQGDATDYTPPNNGPENGNVSWQKLINLGLIQTGTRIRIANSIADTDASNGVWYNFDIIPVDPDTTTTNAGGTGDQEMDPYHGEKLKLTTKHLLLPNGTAPSETLAFTIELAPGILPGSDPVQLVEGIVLDLDQSQTPAVWKVGSNYSRQMDLLFSPEGRVTGSATASGLVHLTIVDNRDRLAVPPRTVSDTNNEGDATLITIFTRTGHITTHTIYQDPVNPDPFRYAQTGETPDEK